MTSPSKSSRRRRSAIIASSHGAGSNSHPLSHSHSRRLPFYPSSKIKSSVAWRLLASKAIRRHFAWGRLVEAVSSSARSWLPRPNVLFWWLATFVSFLLFLFFFIVFYFGILGLDLIFTWFSTCTIQPFSSLAHCSPEASTWAGWWWRRPETRHVHVACHGASSSCPAFSNCKSLVPSRMSSSTRPKSGTREQRASWCCSWNGRVLQMLRFISSGS